MNRDQRDLDSTRRSPVRFSLLHLLGLTSLTAVGFGALKWPSAWCAITLTYATFLLVVVSGVAGAYRRGKWGVFAGGFAISTVSWLVLLYVTSLFVTGDTIAASPLNPHNNYWLFEVMHPKSQFARGLPTDWAYGYWNFVLVFHCFVTWWVGIFGGLLAWYVRSIPDSPSEPVDAVRSAENERRG